MKSGAMRWMVLAAVLPLLPTWAVAQVGDVHIDEQALRTERPYLRFSLTEPAGASRTAEVRLSGRGQGFDLARFSRGDRIGRIRVEIPERPLRAFIIRLLVREAESRWSLQIFPEYAPYAHLPVAVGELRNEADGFHLLIRGADWMESFAAALSLDRSASVEFSLETPLRLPPSGDLVFTVSTTTGTRRAPIQSRPQRIVVER